MIFLLLQLIRFKARSGYKFLRFISGLVSFPTQCYERSKVVRKSSDATAAKDTRKFAAHFKKDMLE